MKKLNLKKSGFTLMELMVVVVLVGIMAAFALPNYAKSVRTSHERDIITQLQTVHAANKLYFSQEGEYLPGKGGIALIEDGLNLDLYDSDKTYSYSCCSATCYSLTITYDDISIKITDADLSSTNPTCVSGNCNLL